MEFGGVWWIWSELGLSGWKALLEQVQTFLSWSRNISQWSVKTPAQPFKSFSMRAWCALVKHFSAGWIIDTEEQKMDQRFDVKSKQLWCRPSQPQLSVWNLKLLTAQTRLQVPWASFNVLLPLIISASGEGEVCFYIKRICKIKNETKRSRPLTLNCGYSHLLSY